MDIDLNFDWSHCTILSNDKLIANILGSMVADFCWKVKFICLVYSQHKFMCFKFSFSGLLLVCYCTNQILVHVPLFVGSSCFQCDIVFSFPWTHNVCPYQTQCRFFIAISVHFGTVINHTSFSSQIHFFSNSIDLQ